VFAKMKYWVMSAALLFAGTTAAEIVPFKLDESIHYSERASAKHIRAAHDTFKNSAGSVEAARFAILRSMTGKAGRNFIFEGEGDGFVDSRIDFKGNPLWIRIEYSKDFLQMKYLDGQRDFKCTNIRDGVCYENHRYYYRFLVQLRRAIRRQLAGM